MRTQALEGPKKRGSPSTLWAKGVSANPSGRPKTDENIRDIFRQHNDLAVRVVVETMQNAQHPQRLVAASMALDRAWGKAPQTLEMTTSTWDALAYTDRAMLARALEIIAAAGLDINGEGTTSPAIDITPTVVDAPVAPCTDDSAPAPNPPSTDQSTPKP